MLNVVLRINRNRALAIFSTRIYLCSRFARSILQQHMLCATVTCNWLRVNIRFKHKYFCCLGVEFSKSYFFCRFDLYFCAITNDHMSQWQSDKPQKNKEIPLNQKEFMAGHGTLEKTITIYLKWRSFPEISKAKCRNSIRMAQNSEGRKKLSPRMNLCLLQKDKNRKNYSCIHEMQQNFQHETKLYYLQHASYGKFKYPERVKAKKNTHQHNDVYVT